MRSARALVVQIAAPLVVLGGVAWVLLHSTSRGDAALEREETRLLARVGSKSDRRALLADLRDFAFLRRRNEEAVAFAWKTLARLHALKDMADAWAEDRDRTRRPGEARAFARAVLPLLAKDVDDPSQPSWMFPRAMQALVEAGDEAATTELASVISTMKPSGVLGIYAPTSRTPSRARDVAADALAKRPEVEVATAGIAMRLSPRRPQGADQVSALVATEDFRRSFPFIWQHLARALGTAGRAEDRAVLAQQRSRLAGDTKEMQTQRLALDVGLALAGDPDAAQRVRASITPTDDIHGVNWAIGLSTRLADGDRSAAAPLLDLWSRGGDVSRLLIGVAVLLADPAPPDDLPCDAWAETLATGPTRVARTVGHAFMLRRKKDGALDALVRDLVDAAREFEAKGTDRLETDESSAVLEALRALARWA